MATPGSSGGSTPASPRAVVGGGFTPLVTVVGFHHARGPEVETWFGAAEGTDPAADYDWGLLPFMALSDGAHASSEDFSYFTLLRKARPADPERGRPEPESATSLFGISCTRQMDASQLINRPSDVTRSTVQKAVVVIADSPQYFGMLRERLSIVTGAWFAQREFTDVEILRRFQESLAEDKRRGLLGGEGEDASGGAGDQYVGMSLRELVREFRWQTLVLLKCCLLQPKMLFFGSRCERLCMMQFALVSLVPGLLRSLQDSADPDLDSYEKRLRKPTSLKTSDRNSFLAYMGLPLQIFGKGSLFGPYTPLQQLDILADFGTKSYIVGSTNSLLLQQRDRYSDILINLDENTINITSTSLKSALMLSLPDRRWIDFITQEVNDTWDEANPSRPKTMGYRGSEEFIRLQFEEYLLSLISSVKYHNCLVAPGNNGRIILPHIEGDPAAEFGIEWVEAWSRTENYRLWNSHTDSELFNLVEPRHPCAGGLTMDDVQRRIAQQVQDLHLDERFQQGKEVLGRNLQAGRDKASSMISKLYADMETMRETQRRKAEEARAQAERDGKESGGGHSGLHTAASSGRWEKNNGASSAHSNPNANTAAGAAAMPAVDLAKAQQTMQAVGAKAGAYMSSWATWASEKRKTSGWGGGGGSDTTTTTTTTTVPSSARTSSFVQGWGLGRVTSSSSSRAAADVERDGLVRQAPHSPGLPVYDLSDSSNRAGTNATAAPGGASSRHSTASSAGSQPLPEGYDARTFRPLTQGSFSEAGSSAPGSPAAPAQMEKKHVSSSFPRADDEDDDDEAPPAKNNVDVAHVAPEMEHWKQEREEKEPSHPLPAQHEKNAAEGGAESVSAS